VRDESSYPVRLSACQFQSNDGPAAAAKYQCGLLTGSVEHGGSIAALLAYFEVLRIVARASGLAATVVGNNLELVGENIGDEGANASIAETAGNHEQRAAVSSIFIVDFVIFGCDAVRCECCLLSHARLLLTRQVSRRYRFAGQNGGQ
jgi:hypothetical protein